MTQELDHTKGYRPSPCPSPHGRGNAFATPLRIRGPLSHGERDWGEGQNLARYALAAIALPPDYRSARI